MKTCKQEPCVLKELLKIFGSKPCDDCRRMGFHKTVKTLKEMKNDVKGE